ncbi:hypothetical protein A9F13_24g00363 [Clavispora lusitaniae]|uniref:Uncharacterized protein n=1 Tax=Clavispora lusitaniae TaxID=36911 RepID=A0AA91PVE9_CLALS|nr:hypothetical protein A9F13_24g00363 [Clavispora lusitaniae]
MRSSLCLYTFGINCLTNAALANSRDENDVFGTSSSPMVVSSTYPAALSAAHKDSWIQDFEDFLGQSSFSAQTMSSKVAPLNSKVTSYRFSQEGDDLRAWTKYLVESHKSQIPDSDATQAASTDIDIDAFIDYLIRYKNFREKDLQFLRRPELDYGQEQIERELTKIKQKQEEEDSKTIDIGGEAIEGMASRLNYSFCAIAGFGFFLLL